MTALTVRLSNSVFQKVNELALHDKISVNQFIAAAMSEKMASVMTLDYLKLEAAKGSRSDFDRFWRISCTCKTNSAFFRPNFTPALRVCAIPPF